MSYEWFAKSISWDWIANGMFLTITTNWPTRLDCYWTLTPPLKIPFYRSQRGVLTRCGYTWKLINLVKFTQLEAGYQETKTFAVTPWPVGRQAWWYFKGFRFFTPSISTSVIWTDTFPGLPGPVIPAAPEIILNVATLIRNGNHYTWWAQGHWYAIIPLPASLRVYKRTAAGWARQDQANEPAFPAGNFSDLDTRLNSTDETIHMAAYLRASVYPPDTIAYYTYDILADVWDVSETIYQNAGGTSPMGRCSISLDSNDIPHVVYHYQYQNLHVLLYSDRVGGVWTIRGAFLSHYFAPALPPSAAHDDSDTFYAAMAFATHNDLGYNSRPAGGPIQGMEEIDTSISSPWPPTVSTWDGKPHVAFIDSNHTLKLMIGPAPWASHPNLWPPRSRYPNLITPPTPLPLRYFLIADNAHNLVGLWWDGLAWAQYPVADPAVCTQLSMTYTAPTCFSYLATSSLPPTNTRFFAFVPPV